ncbi:MAG: hypothetical protein MI744_02280, partial [Pseudomonadales bacterium]|nr:hypothetical protein [Pseudomonadales bacterium]
MPANLDRGYFKIYYDIDNSRSWSRGLQVRGLMLSILQRPELKFVSYKNGIEIPVKACAVVVSSWASELGVDRLALTRMLKTLEKDEFISLKNMNNRFTIITVVNFGYYQPLLDEDEQPQNNQQPTNDTTRDTISEQLPLRDKENIYISRQFLEFA